MKRVGVLALLLCGIGLNVKAQNSINDRARIYEPVIADAASRHGVDPRLLWVIAYLETRFDPRLVSRKGARGMMQFMPNTARRYGLTDPHDPAAAIDAGAKYVRYLSDRFGNRVGLVLAAYNAGETVVDAYLTGRSVKVGDRLINPKEMVTDGLPPYRETRMYVDEGLRILEGLPAKPLLQARNGLHASPQRAGINNEDRASSRMSIRSSSEAIIQRQSNTPTRRSIYFTKSRAEE
jgi:hypothetical protein